MTKNAKESTSQMASETVKDASPYNWVDRWAPARLRPLLRLGRFDRPIGVWLLLWPCWWGVALGMPFAGYSEIRFFILLGWFMLGAFLMRAAGCVYNDFVDREFDARVDRTQARPLANKQVTLLEAWLFMVLLTFLGFWVLLHFNGFTILLGISSLVLVGVYPFMKRITYWPQIVLGLAFNWGVLLGWASVQGNLSFEAFLFYVGAIFWTLGYDTVYAHQDKEDDILIGLKSTALKLGENTKAWLFVFYGIFFGFLMLVGIRGDLNSLYFTGVFVVAVHFLWQIAHVDIHSSAKCLKVFKSNMHVGWILFLSIVLGKSF